MVLRSFPWLPVCGSPSVFVLIRPRTLGDVGAPGRDFRGSDPRLPRYSQVGGSDVTEGSRSQARFVSVSQTESGSPTM